MNEYDVVIVGAGTAGCVLAGRLSEDPSRTVLLVEAGPDFPDTASLPPSLRRHDRIVDDPAFLWSYDVSLLDDTPAPMPQVRGKLVGGSSAVNGALFVRGMPADYDAWGSDLWTFEQLLPYFRKSEADRNFHDEFHGADGPIPVWRHPRERWTPFQEAFYAAAVNLGFPEKPDLNHPVGGGIGPLPQNNPDGVRVTTAMGYLNPHRDRSNLSVQSASMVTRVVFEGRRAVGIEGRVAGQPFAVRANEVILSAGSFGSAQLLLLSGVGPADELRGVGVPVVADRPGVGKNLRCHPSVGVLFRPADGFLPTSTEPQFQTALHYTARGSADNNDMLLLPASGLEGVLAISCGVRVPCSVGDLQLQSADADRQPSIRYGYLHPRDLERLRDSVNLLLELSANPALGRSLSRRLQPSSDAMESDASLDRWIGESLLTSYHTCGTCKLGPETDSMAVVDERCRVHGVEQLRVVDLSIVPQSVRSGPHATVVTLAERAADLIKSG